MNRPPSFANGRPYLAIPGPSTVPDRVLGAMHRASPNIYAGALVDLCASLWPDLRRLAGTAQDVAIYIGNGHALWEAASSNLFSRGDEVMVIASGLFGLGWASSLIRLGVKVRLLDMGRSAAPDPEALAAALAEPGAEAIKAVLLTHVDTATSVKADIAAIRGAMDRLGHPALLCVDCIASMGCDAFLMDDWGVDVALAASQKGLMLPPGIGFVWFSAKARAAGAGAGLRSPYWDWAPRADGPDFWMHWHGTAPTQALFGLREALDMLLVEEGLPAVWARHRGLARAVWAAFDAWGQGHPGIAMNVAEPAHRAHAVTAARLPAPKADELRQWCEARAGLTLGIGLGMAPEGSHEAKGFFRLAHMGHVNAHMTLGALAVMEAGMQAIGLDHGKGAIEAAARVIAGAAGA